MEWPKSAPLPWKTAPNHTSTVEILDANGTPVCSADDPYCGIEWEPEIAEAVVNAVNAAASRQANENLVS